MEFSNYNYDGNGNNSNSGNNGNTNSNGNYYNGNNANYNNASNFNNGNNINYSNSSNYNNGNFNNGNYNNSNSNGNYYNNGYNNGAYNNSNYNSNNGYYNNMNNNANSNYYNPGNNGPVYSGVYDGAGDGNTKHLSIAPKEMDLISERNYNLTIGLVLLWGFFVNFLLVKFVDVTPLIFNSTGMIVFYIAYFVLAFTGITMCKKSDSPKVSFLGYNLVVLPLGMAVNIILLGYESSVVSTALLVTGVVTAVMMALGVAFPDFFDSIIKYVSITLLVTLVVELIVFFASGRAFIFTDYLVALLFCAYIGYDWGKAQQKAKNFDNAVDSAVELYLDIINLFIRILAIMGKANRRR